MKSSSVPLLLAAGVVILILFFAFQLSGGGDDEVNLIPEGRAKQTVDNNLFSGELFFFKLKKGTENFLSTLTQSGDKITFSEKGKEISVESVKLLPGDSAETLFPQSAEKFLPRTTLDGKKGFLFRYQEGLEFLFVEKEVLYKINIAAKSSDKLLQDIVVRIKSR